MVSKGFNDGTDPLSKRTVSDNISGPLKFFSQCPKRDEVNLINLNHISTEIGINSLIAINESKRLGLGSFKALGAVYAIAKMGLGNFINKDSESLLLEAKEKLKGVIFSTASAGNHGLSLAAGAKLFGAKSIIYVSKNVPTNFISQLKSMDATVSIVGNSYDESLKIAIEDSKKNGWILISDSTWKNYDVGLDVMEGYLISISQALDKIDHDPTHIFLQAGVGGLAASFAAYCRKKIGCSVFAKINRNGKAYWCQGTSIKYGKVRLQISL